MTTRTAARTEAPADLMAIFAAALAGLALVYVVGVSHIPAMHDTAHDTRHALSFPCH